MTTDTHKCRQRRAVLSDRAPGAGEETSLRNTRFEISVMYTSRRKTKCCDWQVRKSSSYEEESVIVLHNL